MPNRRHKPTTNPKTRALRLSPREEPEKKEASFQAKLLHAARANGWRVDVADLHPEHRDERFFVHLQAIAPKGKVRSFHKTMRLALVSMTMAASWMRSKRAPKPSSPGVTRRVVVAGSTARNISPSHSVIKNRSGLYGRRTTWAVDRSA